MSYSCLFGAWLLGGTRSEDKQSDGITPFLVTKNKTTMKKLFTALMLTMATTSMMAQEPIAKIELSYDKDYYFTNSKFSVNGQSQLFTIDDKTSTFALYDEYFTKQREFKTIQINTPQGTRKYCTIGCYNYDEGIKYASSIYISQTLFNSDEKYEYLSPIYDGKYTGINVVSEDGTILQTINFGNYYLGTIVSQINLYVINGKKYLFIDDMRNPDSTDPTILIYRIDSETSQINFVAKHEGTLNIHPRVADRSDMITVEMNEEDDNGIREIIVSNAAGQTITRVPVEKGQKSVTIPASELSRGMNIVDAIDRKGHNANKVIVK